MTVLETPRLRLTRLAERHLEALVAYRNDPQVALRQGWELPYPRGKAQELLAETRARTPNEPGGWLFLALEMKDSGEMIGDAAYFIKENDPSQAYLGLTLARPHWRQGYGLECTRALVDYLFGALDLRRLVAECDADNAGSVRMLQRLGFRREAHFIESVPREGGWVDELHFAMLRREWVSQSDPVPAPG